jgi:gliding motility-associated-like protein
VAPTGGNGGPWTYFWSNGGVTSQIGGLLGGTTYTVSVTDSKGCDQEGSISIGNVGAPDIILQAQTDSLCANEEIGFIQIALQSNSNPPYSYFWSHDDNENDALAENLGPGTYTVTVVDGSGCQSISNPINIFTFPSGFIQLGNDTTILKGQTLKLDVLSSTNVSSVNWGPNRFLAHTGFSAYVFPLETTTYWAEGVSVSGCNAYDSLVVFVDSIPFSIYIPNVFSPNGDGVNDFYYVQAENVETFEMHVYDRWGNKVFESYDLSTRWDGTDLSGKTLPAGVFAYVIYVRSFGTVDREPVYSGNITLIR